MDGSGKSTLISKLKDELSQSGQKIVVTHTRLKLFGLKNIDNLTGEKPSYGVPRSTLFSLIKIIVFFWEELLFKMIHRDIDYVIYDRSIYDILVDPGRFRITLNPYVTRTLKVLFKLPETIVFLSGDLMKIQKRKPELSLEKMTNINKKYIKIYSKSSYLKLDTTKYDIETCIDRVVNYVKDN